MTQETTDLGSYGRIWLAVASGGWWKATEIADQVGIEVRRLRTMLHQMRSEGYLSSREIPKGNRDTTVGRLSERTEYAVLPQCEVPRGVKAGHVAESLGLRLNVEAA